MIHVLSPQWLIEKAHVFISRVASGKERWEQLHNTGPLLKVYIFMARLARQWMKERGMIYICSLSPRSIYLVARLALLARQ